MRVLQVVPRVAVVSSGPSVSVPSLCAALQQAGVDTKLMALEPQPQHLFFPNACFLPVAPIPFAKRLGVSPKMKRALAEAACQLDVIHSNSVWMMPNIYPAAAVRGTQCKLVVAPRGTMSRWALKRSRFRKSVLWRCGQQSALQAAHCFHATSEDELQQIRDMGFRQPVAIIPNGVQCPERIMPPNNTRSSGRVLLFLARIHPTKGVDGLLRQWKVISHEFPEWTLRIAGPLNHSYAAQMQSLANDLKLPRVEFIGEVTGELKEETWRQSDLYVLPTHSENFGISVAESLANGVPAIVTKGAPWQGLQDQQAGWWIDHGDAALLQALRTAMSETDGCRSEMGRNGQDWMRREFDWRVIGKRMFGVYQWLVNGGLCPADVVLD
jgi:glycosyltransferase involved in cell wall biosynthesis